ncbi:MAG: site-2 protease family protein [Patescibacteria group bacterium]
MFLSPYYLIALVLVLTFHECSHAWTAHRLGDNTAKREGRLTLNPLAHLDILGTLMLFFVGIGWGKPVPVNPQNFEKPVRDQALTALAGPLANLALAFIAAIPYSYLSQVTPLYALSEAVLDVSIVLFLFNMLPIPPLDGSKFMGIFVPRRFYPLYEKFLSKGLPYFIVLMFVDLYFFEELFGMSFIWTAVSQLTFWLKAAILLIV